MAIVLPASELVHVPEQVLSAHVVEHADVAPLEQATERTDPVGVDESPDVLARAVLQRFMLEPRQSPVRGVAVGVGVRVPSHILDMDT